METKGYGFRHQNGYFDATVGVFRCYHTCVCMYHYVCMAAATAEGVRHQLPRQTECTLCTPVRVASAASWLLVRVENVDQAAVIITWYPGSI